MLEVRTGCAMLSMTLIAGCSSSPPILPAASGQSGFEGSIYSGETTVVSAGTPGATQYRVFEQGATGFVPVAACRAGAEQRAEEFCKRKGLTLEVISDRHSTHVPLPGKFPRVELIFDCIPGGPTQTAGESKYTKLANLKKLLDDGTLSQAEFDREKAKILNAP
jgi:hypothetical protein